MNPIVLLIGLPKEPPLELAANALKELGAKFFVWDQRLVAQSNCEFRLNDDGVAGYLACGDWLVSIEEVIGVYTRMASWTLLPELSNNPTDDALVLHTAMLHEALEAWLEITDARVVNRAWANDSNNSKPYQGLLIRNYFYVPDTCVTNDPSEALAFCDQYQQTIYKSISGERSIVTTFQPSDIDRLHLLRNGPVQFQEWVEGVDVRVHVVGTQVFATRVESSAIDYRYDHSAVGALFTPFELSSDVAQACINLTEELELGLAGLDLRFARDGRIVCFEVNPSPAYSVYEAATGQPISMALAAYLVGL